MEFYRLKEETQLIVDFVFKHYPIEFLAHIPES